MGLYIGIGIIVILLIYVFVTYNKLVSLKIRVDEAFSTMDVYLKKRWDLIPNIVETVKGYAEHEKSTLEAVVALRNGAYNNMSTENKLDVNNKLTDALSRLMLISENYPELKASENFKNLSNELVKVEDEIANARKYYNGTVRLMNNKVQMFPSNLVAKMFGYKNEKMFEAIAEERENVNIKL